MPMALVIACLLVPPCLCSVTDMDQVTDLGNGEKNPTAEASAKFVKIEKMRHRHFSAISGEMKRHVAASQQRSASVTLQRSNAHAESDPVEQIALFRDETRKHISGKIARIMEVSRNRERARQMARDRMQQLALDDPVNHG
jgi:hypothetical protein